MKKQTILISMLSLSLFGCATHKSETEALRNAWKLGNTAEAQTLASEAADEKKDSADGLIWLLEEGAACRANADFAKSEKSFSDAYLKVKKFEEEADISLSNEAKGILLNQSYTEYKGYNYDKIMLSIYQSLNYLETKDFEKAYVELRRLKNFQDDAKRINLKRIEKAEKSIKEAKNKDENAKGINESALLSQAGVGSELSKYYGQKYAANPASALQEAKNIYVNPFGTWLYGIAMLNSKDSAEREEGAAAIRIASEMLGNKSEVLNSDSILAEKIANGELKDINATYIVFETGCAPIREQFRLDLPLYIINKDLPHVSVNFPYLSKQDDFLESPNAVADGKPLKFDILANMDDIIEEEFYIELPLVVSKTLISSAAKAAAQYFAAKAAGDYGIFVNIGMSVLQATLNDADLRTWTTLPKQIKIAKTETPKDGKILIDNTPVYVNKKGLNIIYVKSMSKNGVKLVRTMDFNPLKTKK